MTIYFDMDGTIADLYGVPAWLECLMHENTYPYIMAKPLLNLSRLARLLHKVQRNGYKIGIISWTSKSGTDAYNEQVATAKMKWLAKHLPSVKWNEIHITAYGVPKSTCGEGILFDDEEPNRTEWGKGAYEPDDIFEVLAEL